MGRTLNEIRFVDLKKSGIDWETSDPQKGQYKLKKGGKFVYVDYKSDSAPIPDHKVQWVNKKPETVDLWRYRYDYELVRWQDKDYWPEGFIPNAEGWYQYRDVVLMKCPAHLYVERKRKEIEKSMRAANVKFNSFRDEAARDGVKVYNEEETQELRRDLRR